MRLASKPILIVDDERNIRLTLSHALEALGHRLDEAGSGEEALVKLEIGEFGIMLLDLKMPGMDGMELLRRLQDIRPDVRIIIITAHGTIDSAVEAMKLSGGFHPETLRSERDPGVGVTGGPAGCSRRVHRHGLRFVRRTGEEIHWGAPHGSRL